MDEMTKQFINTLAVSSREERNKRLRELGESIVVCHRCKLSNWEKNVRITSTSEVICSQCEVNCIFQLILFQDEGNHGQTPIS